MDVNKPIACLRLSMTRIRLTTTNVRERNIGFTCEPTVRRL